MRLSASGPPSDGGARSASFESLFAAVAGDGFQCGFAPSLYETLAVVVSPFDKAGLGPEWPATSERHVRRLAQTQNAGGFWSSDDRIASVPDRIITTLIALAALHSTPSFDPTLAERAIHYLQQHVPAALTAPESQKTIAFDSLVAELLLEHQLRGRQILPGALLEKLVLLRDTKLQSKRYLLTSRRGTIHSVLDAISSASIDWPAVGELQESDGSMGIYPSSTAALLTHLPETSPAFERGVAYLRNAMDAQGAFPPFYPSAEFERWWALLALSQSPLLAKLRLPDALVRDIPHDGISVAATFSLPDVDTASMKAATLLTAGYPVDLGFLERFYRHGVFECYEYENRLSPSANVHALMAIVAKVKAGGGAPGPVHERMLKKALGYLLEVIGPDDHLQDKWHLSALYTTSHAIELFVELLALGMLDDDMTLKQAIQSKLPDLLSYVISCQSSDGGMGAEGPSTVEETGYGVRALCVAEASGVCVAPAEEMARAGDFLAACSVEDDPPLWLGKTLYRSPLIAHAQQISASAWLERRAGAGCS